MTYEEAHKSLLPAAYVTFQFGGNDFYKHQEFTVGDGVQSSNKIRSKRSNGEEYYYNKPLHPNTNYRVFLRAFVSEVFLSTNVLFNTITQKTSGLLVTFTLNLVLKYLFSHPPLRFALMLQSSYSKYRFIHGSEFPNFM